jgi:hypothetical protein
MMQAIAYDLGRAIKMIHVADLLTGSTSESITLLQAAITDARLADAMVAIDGYVLVLTPIYSYLPLFTRTYPYPFLHPFTLLLTYTFIPNQTLISITVQV